MKNALRHRHVALAVLVLLLGTAAWGSDQRGEHSGVGVTAGAAELLTAIPTPTGHSDTDMAIAHSMAVVRQKGSNAESWVNLGDALMRKVFETADADYHGYAEQSYEKALMLSPKNSGAITGMAWVHGGRRQFAKSIEWATKAIALNEQNNLAHGLLGDAHLELGDYAAAYKQMMDLKPDTSSYSRSAHLLHVTGQNFRAAWLMRLAIAAGAPSAQDTAWCRAQLALIYFSDGNYHAAESVLKDALQRMPDNRHALAVMGKVKAALNDYSAAIAFYQKAIAIRPEHESLVALGDLYALTGDNGAAEMQYALVEALHRKSPAAADTTPSLAMAQFYVDHDRNLVEALRLAEERKTTKNVFETDILAWCYFKNGQPEQARTVIKRALTQRVPDAKILFHAGMIYAKLEDRVTAQKYLYQALSMNPNFDPIDAAIAAQALHELGQPLASTVRSTTPDSTGDASARPY